MANPEMIVVATFPEESKTFQAFSEIKRLGTGPDVKIQGLAIVRRTADGRLETPDVTTRGYGGSLTGGLIGSLIGILGGPLGILLGWGTGALIGGLRDASEVRSDISLLQRLTEDMRPGEIALIGHVEEKSSTPIDAVVRRLGGEILRRPSDEVEAEISSAERAGEAASSEARRVMGEHRAPQRDNAPPD